jgi:hypothetical protein
MEVTVSLLPDEMAALAIDTLATREKIGISNL